jgi:hypothetical protein
MARPLTERPVFDLFDDMMAIARIEAAITSADRRKAPMVRDFTRLARFLPDYKL